MALIPDPPFPKTRGTIIRSKDWNDLVDEVIRLDGSKVNRAGDALTGPLTIDGALGVGTTAPGAPLHVADHMVVGPFAATTGVGGIDVTGPAAELGFVRRDLAAWPATPAAGDRYVWYNQEGAARLWTEVNGDLLTIGSNGSLRIRGPLTIPNSSEGTASLTNATFANEAEFQPNNVKLSLGATRFIVGGQPLTYEFAVGHSSTVFGPGGFANRFVKRFSINQNGDAFFAGGKTGYVVDYVLNRVGDTVELGDLVVIGAKQTSRYTGTNNNIPLLEVDLTDQAYNTRVCGIIEKVVTEADLPFVELLQIAEEKPKRGRKKQAAAEEPYVHPLQEFAATAGEDLDHTQVRDQQIAKMVTLGAFAHCKVDADIAAINAGDLLTTSPTRGHAQKVLEPEKAIGAIVGKALGSLKKGKGTIPVLVMLQ